MTAYGKLRVLVLDADPRHREALSLFLGQRGFESTELGDPDHLLEVLKGGRYQVILLDLDSVSQAAPPLLPAIRSIDDDLCVICFTAQPDVGLAVASMRHGAFDYLKKPVDFEALRRSLDEAIQALGLGGDKLEQLPALVGRRLRTRRQELGLTLRQVAKRSGLALSQISQAERGEGAVTIRTLYKIATALKTPMGQFFGDV